MELKRIIEIIAFQADDFLDGVTSRDQARAAISEMITLGHVELSGEDRARVIHGVMAILEHEGFFDSFRVANEDNDED